ncbi:hypothetical protein EsVE80_12240 [Enterococcus saigonensis]|uniref:Uncharacterized protein n=1 Tax=Enterococcus saigonensis TaxID=1805431 RepID=A0A679ILU9_9ENTE|nr:hypothetical protein [Enterococcus saigonensis]BCA85701.1 hypothetical protein EsVE80_12240 [Enterococcus saigonensis]
MKTALTLAMEEALYFHCRQKGDVVIEEVVMPDDQGIVDTLSCKILPNQTFEWRCYELKVSKADFKSTAKLSFVGHLNYFVLPQSLYEKVKEEIPTHVGVLIFHPYLVDCQYDVPGYFETVKKAQRQPLQVNENELLYHLITSQAREVNKAKQTERGLRVFSTDQLYKELKRREKDYDIFNGGINYYDRFIAETQNQAIEALKEELDATRDAYFTLEQRWLEEQ